MYDHYIDNANTKEKEMEQAKEITVRANGKCHPALHDERYGMRVICNCPGSQNGTLNNTARKVADGFDKVNCRKK